MKKVMKFETVNCQFCKMIEPMLKGRAESGEFELEIVDAEQQPELAEKYNIMSVPTAVIFEDGKEPIIARGIMDINKALNV